jgi:hypothetical protein
MAATKAAVLAGRSPVPPMRLLEYADLDTRGLAQPYARVTAALAAGDFRAAQVKKLAAATRLPLYRAKLNEADRLLFTLVRCGAETAALMLEVVRGHDYTKSRFLRGASIDESKVPEIAAVDAVAEAAPIRYLHPSRSAVQLLDKPISFDDTQFAVCRQPAPLIVVGSAGSGKTALTLEKLKQARGEVLYVTHSAFLAQCARDLYFAHGFEATEQEASFLSLRAFLETLRVPAGQEATWPRFAAWFARQRQAFREFDAHQAFEEIRGVISAQPEGVLGREAYCALGVRQSIYTSDLRDRLYDLFERYRRWLLEEQLFDLNLLAHERLPLAAPRYDFVVIDEVQDLAPVQLAVVLKTLAKPGQFLLCGDSNQIVHPNFFAWSRVKSLFWRDAELAGRQELRLLAANFRNSAETTRIANTLLKIKQRRFGSIDRESNFLVRSVGAEAGKAVLLADREPLLRELDRQVRQSTEVAVLVLRDEDKPAARQVFATPLLFSVHEAKGLEYENIVLFRFVSGQRSAYAELAEGVSAADLDGDELAYRRARDKEDKSLEIHKFFVNALYVALTRAQRNVYLVESDPGHPLLALLRIGATDSAQVQARTASREDWQREAHRLELQGKLEQAQAIRRDVLKQARPPWQAFDEARLRDSLVKVFREQLPSSKLRQQLLDHAALADAPDLAELLGIECRFGSREQFERQRPGLVARQLAACAGKNFKDVLRQCDQYGVDYRSPSNLTPLMAAAATGNLALVDALLERGADLDAVDDYGQAALHWALREAFARPEFANGPLAALYERLAPAALDLQAGERLLRIDRRLSEYLLLQTLWVTFRGCFTRCTPRGDGGFDSSLVVDAWQHLPASVLRPERNKRSHVSALLSRNEVDRDYAYNRALFRRIGHGRYRFNAALQVRIREAGEDAWVPLLRRLNLGLVNELCISEQTNAVHALARDAGWPELPVPIAGERAFARARERLQTAAARRREAEADLQRRREALLQQRASAAAVAATGDPPWGTKAAKRLAVQRLLERNAARRRAGDGDGGADP